MTSKKKALLIGDFTDPPYHPLDKVEQEISTILLHTVTVHSTEDYNQLHIDQLRTYDLCISYTDCFTKPVSSEQTAGLLAYVSGGGALLVIHNGISLQNKYELCQMIGAKFTGHPPFQTLEFQIAAVEHPIMQGIQSFTIDDEPYRFKFDPFTETIVLFEYTYEGERYPAAWAHDYGLGRVVYLMPGHQVQSFVNPMYRQIIKNSSRWAMKEV